MASDLLAQRLRELKAKLDQLLTDAVSLRVNIDQMLNRGPHPASPVPPPTSAAAKHAEVKDEKQES